MKKRLITTLVATSATLATGVGAFAASAPAQAAGDDLLSVQVTGHNEFPAPPPAPGSDADPDLNNLVVDAKVCVDRVPAGDLDGRIDVKQSDWNLLQSDAGEPRSFAPWDGVTSEVVSDSEAFPREASLAAGECVDGKLPFVAMNESDSNPGSTFAVFKNDYGQFTQIPIR